MKHIVVYTIIILGLVSLNVSAQKPSIDLLPTTSESTHPEAMIDTSITHDSLILFDSLTLSRDSLRGAKADLKYLGDTSPALHQKTIGKSAGIRLGLNSLFFKKNKSDNFHHLLHRIKILTNEYRERKSTDAERYT